jgi:hypothetical protein
MPGWLSRVDRRAAPWPPPEIGPSAIADVELDGEHVALQRHRDAAGGRGEAEEGDRTVDVELEPGLDVTVVPSALVSIFWLKRPDIELDRRARLEGQADVAAETGLQAEVGVGSEPSPSIRNTASMSNWPIPSSFILAWALNSIDERILAEA